MARALERKTHTRIPENQETKVIRLYLDGWSAAQIGAEYGTTFSPVYRILKKHGVKRSKTGERNRKITESVKQLALSTFESGSSGREAAEAAGISESSMSSLLQEEGISSRRNVREFTEEEELEIVRRYKLGGAGAEIAADFGVFHKRIYSIIRSMGATVRRPPRHPWVDRKGRKHVFRSRWELEVAKLLDERGATWNYEQCTYSLVDRDGRNRRYTPDFWVYEDETLSMIIEVKGRWFGDQKHRIGLLVEQYPHLPIEIWNAKRLRAEGVLDRITYGKS
ncbi:MAG: hypothetical protein AB7L09_00070 [Nitrospira sp.]